MTKSEILPRREYAFREQPSRRSPLQRVRVVEQVRRGKWKVVWIDPNPGLTGYVDSQQLVVPWNQHAALLRDERNAARLTEHNVTWGYQEDSPLNVAIDEVFICFGDRICCVRGILTAPRDALQRVMARSGMELGKKLTSPAYADRRGLLHLPIDQTIDLAKRFCAKEPDIVVMRIDSLEREMKLEASGSNRHLGYLVEDRAPWALVRQWAGRDSAAARREEYIDQLERLVCDAIYVLQRAGLDREANRFRKAVGKD